VPKSTEARSNRSSRSIALLRSRRYTTTGVQAVREDRWLEAIAVGSLAFPEQVKTELDVEAVHQEVVQPDGTYALRTD
jgi:hypothetical protein